MNLILAFAVALKHKLRFEPDIAYDDLVGLVGYLDTFAKEAHDPDAVHPPRKSTWKAVGEHLGLPFAASNPRKLIKRAKKPLGNLPLEILNYLTAYIDLCVANGTLKSTLHQGQVSKCIHTYSVHNYEVPQAGSVAECAALRSRRPGFTERSPYGDRTGPAHPAARRLHDRHFADRVGVRPRPAVPAVQLPGLDHHPGLDR